MRNLCDVKFFIEVDEVIMYLRRMKTTAVEENYFWNAIVKEYRTYRRKVLDHLEETSSTADDHINNTKLIHFLDGERPLHELTKFALDAIPQ